mmetsp:Transcript_32360/g.78666  ORF Transcript_32360/g.78666 Transcript_32360/m.78666 type:complete len:714 (-) Transcript_32360:95-2236(-)
MSGLDLLDADVGVMAPNPAAVFGNIAMNGDEYVRCNRCGYGGCDVRVQGCGCTLHSRCVVIPAGGKLTHCPSCHTHTAGLVLFPMSFREIDEARKSASLSVARGKGRKRKSGDAELDASGSYVSERRTGRWTTEEMAYCDKLIQKFESGELPLCDGIKLNEFLGNMLKSKQSRLTKKMKNAKLSSRTFQSTAAGLVDINEAREFSELEEAFFQSLSCPQQRAEIKFHMQREWREQFSAHCVAAGVRLDADAWLNSVEEMDRRSSEARDAAKMARRKLMMGFALRTDAKNPDQGVFIERTEADDRVAEGTNGLDENNVSDHHSMLQALAKEAKQSADINGKSSLLHSAPFLSKVMAYTQRHNVPFEHVDLWVPSFIPTEDHASAPANCRLCFAGSSTVDDCVGADGKTRKPLTAETHFNLFAFGDYSQKFSFDVGCGLPGRVYESGRPTWEQSVQNAPHNHFERCGGALQWGIKTVLGIPIASPNVGRIVVILYSCHDRPKDQELVGRLSDEFTKLLPSPKWKLVVDIGEDDPIMPTASPTAQSNAQSNTISSGLDLSSSDPVQEKLASVPVGKDHRIDEIVSLLGELMPSDPNSPLAPYLPGFMSLRLLLLRTTRTAEEEEHARTTLDSYSSYSQSGRQRTEIGVMLARDYMFLSQQKATQPSPCFFSVGQGLNNSQNPSQNQALSGYSVFDVHNSPTLGPIPIADALSIVSN